ncbi:uncharacterized protein EI90DRAFT_3014026 [Cantharellus anzutake]|uniref:uncharacterized protein n=1 Tax=Cantharellus anzutake TaxID=1750568 RepID=UPI001905D8AE|nr:uncharacterized protein EI90DRAFT_3014026 [Cantharellus anzutake]KAF8337084.1 hypothetical protein EI90DRAFT_3014026 [Cantharellus anzutake]
MSSVLAHLLVLAVPDFIPSLPPTGAVNSNLHLLRMICYGELHEILERVVPTSEQMTPHPHFRQWCLDVALPPTSFTALSYTTQILVFASVSSVCGWLHCGMNSGPNWATIDRGSEPARPVFSMDDDD